MVKGITLHFLCVFLMLAQFQAAVPCAAAEPVTPSKMVTPSKPASIPRVVAFQIGDKFDRARKRITHQTATFTPKTKTIYVTVTIEGLDKGAEIVCILRVLNVKDINGKALKKFNLASTSVTSPGAEALANFNFTAPPRGWRTGSYMIGIIAGENVLQTIPIAVK